jgi:tight adherence protein C
MISYLARMDTATMIVWALAFGAVVAVLGFVFTFFAKNKKSKRIKQVITQHRGNMSALQTEALNKPAAIRQRSNTRAELAQKLIAGLKLQNLMSSRGIRDNLAMAGLRGQSAVSIYIASRVVGTAIGFVLTLIFVGTMKEFPYPDFVRFIFAGIGAAVGFYLPRILLSNTVQKRQDAMLQAFPDALDLLLICVESGLGIEMAINKVTEEIMDSAPVLSQEFGLTSAELAFLGDRRQAYENFAKRTGLPAAKSLATTLIQSEQYGTSVAQALGVLAQEKRDERLSAAERKAAALPAKLTVPMIIFFLPVLFIVVIGPAALQM